MKLYPLPHSDRRQSLPVQGTAPQSLESDGDWHTAGKQHLDHVPGFGDHPAGVTMATPALAAHLVKYEGFLRKRGEKVGHLG